MRVLMVCKACIVGIYQRKLELIARQGVELRVVVPPRWDDRSGPVMLERAHLEGYTLAVTPLRWNGNYHLFTFSDLGKQIRDFRPHIVHIDEEPYNAAAWQALWFARRQRARSVFFSWQNIARRYPPPFSWGERWVLRNVDHALAGTESAAVVWRDKGYRGPLTVIPQFGVDPDVFSPAPVTAQVEQDSSPYTPTILFAGRLVREKGVDLLVDAVHQLAKDGLRTKLAIVGQGPERNSLAHLAEGYGLTREVTFVGQIPSVQMPAVYREADVLVLPSRTFPTWKEQFGRALVEAMACGVPVIGSSSGAIPDVIGDAGLTFPEGNVQALAQCLGKVLQDTRLGTQLGARGRVRVLESFTHDQVARHTVAAYRSMLG